jgi:hypothetical protein
MPPPFRLVEGFAAGALGMLAFHQPVAALFHRAGLYPAEAFVLTPGWMGLPQVAQGALWSGLWGVLFLLLHRRLAPRVPLLLAAPLYCAVVPIGFLFGVMSPWAGAGFAWGLPAEAALRVMFTHLAWGAGLALCLYGARGAVAELTRR